MFTIYGRTNCEWCDRAKELLESTGHKYDYVDIYSSVRAQEMFKDKAFKTVPQVFFDIKHIGGYDALENYLDTL